MSDLTQELVNNSVKELQQSNLYVDNNSRGDDYSGVSNAYSNSKIGVVVTDEDSLTYYDKNNVAQQILKANPSYQNIIVVVDGKYGASGKNSDSILKILNSNGKGITPPQTLINSAPNIVKLNEVKSETVATHNSGGSSTAPLIGGGVTALIIAAIAGSLLLSKARKRNNNEKLMGDTVNDNPPMVFNKQAELRNAISDWNSLNNNPNTEKFNLTELTQTSKEIVTHWSELDNPLAKVNAERIISEEIPKTLKLYYALPHHYQNKSNGGDKTPKMIVEEQLTIMNDSLKETLDALYSGKINELEIQSVFIKDKYKNNISSLSGD